MRKILFVCQGNVVRSQIAETFFNNFYDGEILAISAGTEAAMYGCKKLGEFASYSVKCMKEIGFDIKDKIPKQLMPELIEISDKVIVMAERHTWPQYLVDCEKEVWDIKNPETNIYEEYVKARDLIKKNVEKLITKI